MLEKIFKKEDRKKKAEELTFLIEHQTRVIRSFEEMPGCERLLEFYANNLKNSKKKLLELF